MFLGNPTPFHFDTAKPTFTDLEDCVDFFTTANKKYATIYEDGTTILPGRHRSLMEFSWFVQQYKFNQDDAIKILLKKGVKVFGCKDVKRVVFYASDQTTIYEVPGAFTYAVHGELLRYLKSLCN